MYYVLRKHNVGVFLSAKMISEVANDAVSEKWKKCYTI